MAPVTVRFPSVQSSLRMRNYAVERLFAAGMLTALRAAARVIAG